MDRRVAKLRSMVIERAKERALDTAKFDELYSKLGTKLREGGDPEWVYGEGTDDYNEVYCD